jgi:hypothetical protein
MELVQVPAMHSMKSVWEYKAEWRGYWLFDRLVIEVFKVQGSMVLREGVPGGQLEGTQEDLQAGGSTSWTGSHQLDSFLLSVLALPPPGMCVHKWQQLEKWYLPPLCLNLGQGICMNGLEFEVWATCNLWLAACEEKA